MADKSAVPFEAAFEQAVTLHRRGRFDEARLLYQQVLQLRPRHFDALHLLGVVAAQTDHPEHAAELIGNAILINPQNVAAHNNYGNALCRLNRYTAAVESYDRAIALQSNHADAHCNRGAALLALERYEAAIASYDRTIALSPNNAAAHCGRGIALLSLGQRAAAIASFDESIALSPANAAAYYNRGIALLDLRQYEAAIASYDKAIEFKPDYPEAYINRGFALFVLRQYEAAIASYDRAIALNPDYADVYSNRGSALFELMQYEAAVASFDRALAVSPNNAEACFSRGVALVELERHEAAIASFDRALALKPDLEFLDGARLNAKIQICDWDNLEAEIGRLAARIERDEPAAAPFLVMALTDSPALQRKAAQIWVRHECPPNHVLPPLLKRGKHDKIRIGYFSADLRERPVSMSMAELFETHDRSNFELSVFSFGEKTFDRFIDIRRKSDREIALLARSMELDIAIDLGGFTQGGKPQILAMRAAPLQVSYLGYSGTMCADYIDYLMADPTLIPEDERRHHGEKIIYLPHGCLANDSTRSIADEVPTREELGLPRKGFVFCCFGHSHKIMPGAFDSWMRILRRVDDSVLWLSDLNPAAAGNLRKEAALRGVGAERLIFARPMASRPEHLSRHRVADLFVDSLPYNAHAAAGDALWAGLPVLTCMGQAFAGRATASLLNAVGLPELIASSREQFEELAVELACNPRRLAAIKQKLADNRFTTPLFDTPLLTRHLESAFTAIYERYHADPPTEHGAAT